MSELFMVGVDLAKSVFQLHGITQDGTVLFRKKLTRPQFERFLREMSVCKIVFEACASAHHWGRTAINLGHEVRLIAPAHVKPFVKRHKSDVIDAEAITEAAMRPSMRFVTVKTEEQQIQAVAFRTRELLVRQRTQLINAFRAHLAEFGVVINKGPRGLAKLDGELPEVLEAVPTNMKPLMELYARQIVDLCNEIKDLNNALKSTAMKSEETRRMQTMPGIGPISAHAIQAYCPPMHQFQKGRDFAAWLGLVPRQNSTGGKVRLGRVTKMGQRDVRRLLITGAMAVITAFERRERQGDPWLAKMLEKRPRIVAAVALANRMARRLWAMLSKEENYEIRGAT